MSILSKVLLFSIVSSALAAPSRVQARQDYGYIADRDVGSSFSIHRSCNTTQAHFIAKGLNENIELVTVAKDHVLKYSNDSEIYRKYFGNRPPYEVIGAYDLVIHGDRSNVLFRCDNPDGNCDIPGWGGHWRGSNASDETVICDLSYETRKSLDYVCTLGYTVAVSPTNTFWASDLLHRLFHIHAFGWGHVEHFAEDYDQVIELAADKTSTDSTHDSDTLQYFSLEVYAYTVAVPGEGCPGHTTHRESSSATVTPTQTVAQTGSVSRASSTAPTPESSTTSAPAKCHTHDNGDVHCS